MIDEERILPPAIDEGAFYKEEYLKTVGRHGRTYRYEACVYCGRKPAKQFRGSVVCRMCRQMIINGVQPRGK